VDLSSESVAPGRAPAHCDLPGLPIDLGDVFLWPCKSKDEVLSAEVGDSKVHSLGVPIHLQDCINGFGDGPCFIWQPIYVIDCNRVLELSCCESVVFNIAFAHEEAGSSTVYQGRSCPDLSCVCGLDLHLDYQRSRAGGSSKDVLLGKFALPSWNAEKRAR